MYKTQLQEMCQKKQWCLPKYASAKVGPDHDPRFSASVFVNGVSFNATDTFRSSKEAQNQAARIAFFHYSGIHPSSSSSPFLYRASTSSPSASSSSNLPNVKGEVNGCLVNGETSRSKDVELQDQFSSPRSSDQQETRLQFMYKNQLQSFTQKRNLSLPEYVCIREGPSHAPRFKSSVTVDGQTFEGSDFSRTLKEAEHVAARVALEALSQGGQEEEFVLCKNLLQELCMKEGISLPIYRTNSSGLSHLPDFTSRVEIAGETFNGKPAKTKKQAEVLAAKAAWSHLKERHSTQNSFYSQICQVQEALEQTSLGSTSVVTIDLGQNHEVEPNIVPSSKPESGNGAKKWLHMSVKHVEDKSNGFLFTKKAALPCTSSPPPCDSTQATLCTSYEGGKSSDEICCEMQKGYHSTAPPILKFDEDRTNTRRQHQAFDNVYAHLEYPFSASPNKNLDLSESSFTDEKIGLHPDKVKSQNSHLCNKILVYSRASGVKFPAGAIHLPIGDEEWIAVRVECSSNEVN